MAKCNSCVHFDVCEKYGATVDFDVDDGVCLHYEKQVVRCKDCWKPRKFSDGSLYCPFTKLAVEYDDFCSYGERKDNG